jgi:release factor glutamine methyltransferase
MSAAALPMPLPSLYAEQLATLREAMQSLPDKPEETPEATLRALWCLATGQAMSADAASRLSDTALPSLNDTQLAQLDQFIGQRLAGTPLAHITGRQCFMGLEMLAGPQALIPRRETELLARAALVHLHEMALQLATQGAQPRVIDVCTGSGNLALAMAHGVPQALVWGADLSPQAVELARANTEHLAPHLGLSDMGLNERVQWRCGDLLAPFDEGDGNTPYNDATSFLGHTDLLLCNPPYISSGKLDSMPAEIIQHEPSLAFDGGPFGIRILQRLMKDAPRFLRSGGWLGLEVGLGQGPAVQQWLARTGMFDAPRAVLDEHGQVRSLLAQRL